MYDIFPWKKTKLHIEDKHQLLENENDLSEGLAVRPLLVVCKLFPGDKLNAGRSGDVEIAT